MNEPPKNSIRIEKFTDIIEKVEVIGMALIMDRSCYVWLSLASSPKVIGSLVTSISTKYEAMPLCTTILEGQSHDDAYANGLARRLSKRYNIQCFISSNIPESFEEGLMQIEQRVKIIFDKYFRHPAIMMASETAEESIICHT
mmetsp:Transcript_17454/g.17548  ORF Transcript_17454/g.17548 Transcript_17454/m.17548 type:complete len:143 (+) Transcript_17454:122-550(+)